MAVKSIRTGLIGWPVAHSFSPVLQAAAAAHFGLDFTYELMPTGIGQLTERVESLLSDDFRGANVTIPYKQSVLPLMDRLSPAAAAIGAVNTIVVEDLTSSSGKKSQQLVGYNTDYSGFMDDLASKGIPVRDRTCLVLGAGGSARAVTYGLALAGARVHLFARRHEQASRLVEELAESLPESYPQAHAFEEVALFLSYGTPLMVNTTPVGMDPQIERTPWPERTMFPRDADLYDLIYNPLQTRLLRDASEAGCRTFNGLGMLLHQAAESFALWTGLRPPIEQMSAAIFNK